MSVPGTGGTPGIILPGYGILYYLRLLYIISGGSRKLGTGGGGGGRNGGHAGGP